jgi:hypothetical protein
VIALSVSLLTHAAWRESPTWDEIGHLVAGVSHWAYGNFDLYRVNPPLVRMVGTVPVAALGPEFYWDGYSASPGLRPEFAIGLLQFSADAELALLALFLSRSACAAFTIVGAIVCGLWSRRLYGRLAGLACVAWWCFDPTVLAYGHLISPDVGAAALAALATLVLWQGAKVGSWYRAILSGLAVAAALLAKNTSLALLPIWTLLVVIAPSSQPVRQRLGRWCGALVLAWYCLNAAYAFEGTGMRLGSFWFVSSALSGVEQHIDQQPVAGNRFRGSWLGSVPIPLPKNYVAGIDQQKRDFDIKLWSYLRGDWQRGGWWYYYLYALAIKVPLGTWALIFMAAWCSLFRKGYSAGWRDELVLLAPLFTVLIFVSSQTGFSHHMRYVLPIFPFAFIWASKVFRSYKLKHTKTFAVACAALLWSVVSSLSVYPHSLSYFNELVGGPKGGHWHLGNSNIDWGQDLLYLKKWLDAHPEAAHSTQGPIGVSYDNILDPSVVGIEYTKPPVGPTAIEQELPPAAEQGPLPGWYAISVNHLHGRTKEYEYFLRFEPVAMAGYSIYIYHLTPDQVNSVRRELGLPEAEANGKRQAVSTERIP